MGPIWSRLDPGGPHVGPINFAIWVGIWNLCQVYSDQCVSMIKSILSITFYAMYGLCVLNLHISLLVNVRILVRSLVLWIFSHCLWLGHETIVYAVCLAMFRYWRFIASHYEIQRLSVWVDEWYDIVWKYILKYFIYLHLTMSVCLNSLAPGGFDFSLKLVNFKLISMINISSIFCEIAIRWMP